MPFQIDPYPIGVYPFSIGGYFPDSYSTELPPFFGAVAVHTHAAMLVNSSCQGMAFLRGAGREQNPEEANRWLSLGLGMGGAKRLRQPPTMPPPSVRAGSHSQAWQLPRDTKWPPKLWLLCGP